MAKATTPNTNKEITPAQPQQPAQTAEDTTSTALAVPASVIGPNVALSFDTSEGRNELKLFAEALALRATITPKRFRGRENIGNCMLALDMSGRMGVNVLMIMKNLYDVNGEPGWKAEFLIARVNQCGRFTSLDYEWRGKENTDEWSCRAWASDRDTGDKRTGAWISIKMAKDEGWYGKSGSKWKTMPEQMLMYRAGAFWQRTHAPELSLGLPTYEELEDTAPVERRPLGDVMRGRPIEQATVITTGDGLSVEQLREQQLDELRTRIGDAGLQVSEVAEALGRSIEEWSDEDLAFIGEKLIAVESGVTPKEQAFK